MENKRIILQKVKMLGDVSKFSWAQAFSDKNGKTSITSILTAVTVIGGMFVFVVTGIAALFGSVVATTICGYAVVVLTGGTGASVVNKMVGGKTIMQDTVVDVNVPDTKDASDVTSEPNGPNTIPDIN